jgi:hypothetical protein
MKRCSALFVTCVLTLGCSGSREVGGIGPSSFFSLTGTISDPDGMPISDAIVNLFNNNVPPPPSPPGFSKSTVSHADGRYSFSDVVGNFLVTVAKDGYQAVARSINVATDSVLDITLERAPTLTPSTDPLTPGTVLRGTVKGPPCDPNWDASAPCIAILYTPETSGTLELVLTWVGGDQYSLDLLIGRAYWGDGSRVADGSFEIRASLNVQAGVSYTIQIHSYYDARNFELVSTFHPTP